MTSCGRPSATRPAARSSTSWSATARSAPAGWPNGCRSPARPSPSTWSCSNGPGSSAGASRAGRFSTRWRPAASTRRPGPWLSSPPGGTGGSPRSSASPKPRTRKTGRRKTGRRKTGRRKTAREESTMTEKTDKTSKSAATTAPGLPAAVDRATFQAELDRLRVREKAHTREGDAIAAARRRLPMVEVDPGLTVTGPRGPVMLFDAFEGRRQLIAYYFMWWDGHPAAEQCEGCTWVTSHVGELSYLHSRDITYAVFCQGPYEESRRYRDFMGWDMPWYSAAPSIDALLVGRQVGRFQLV